MSKSPLQNPRMCVRKKREEVNAPMKNPDIERPPAKNREYRTSVIVDTRIRRVENPSYSFKTPKQERKTKCTRVIDVKIASNKANRDHIRKTSKNLSTLNTREYPRKIGNGKPAKQWFN